MGNGQRALTTAQIQKMQLAGLAVFAITMWVALKAMGSANSQPMPVMPTVTTESLLVGSNGVEYAIDFSKSENFTSETSNLAKIGKAFGLATKIDADVLVWGHAFKGEGLDSEELDLSDQRAEAVATILRSMGLPPDRVTAFGMGRAGITMWEDSPTTEGLALYQRVEINVIPRGE